MVHTIPSKRKAKASEDEDVNSSAQTSFEMDVDETENTQPVDICTDDGQIHFDVNALDAQERKTYDTMKATGKDMIESVLWEAIEPQIILNTAKSALENGGDEKVKGRWTALAKAATEGLKNDEWDSFLNLDLFKPVGIHPSDELAYVHSDHTPDGGKEATVQSWIQKFEGNAHELLLEHLKLYVNPGGKQPFALYANCCSIVQSSGMGKSRAVSQLGTIRYVIPLCLRDGEDGYPPPDKEIRDYLKEAGCFKNQSEATDHFTLFLTAVLMATKVKLEELKKKDGAPQDEWISRFAKTIGRQDTPNQERQVFLANILTEARKLKDESKRTEQDKLGMKTKEGSQERNSEDIPGQISGKRLETKARELYKFVHKNTPRSKREGEDKDVQFLIALDEAHVLDKRPENPEGMSMSDPTPWTLFSAFRKAAHSLLSTPVWLLFLSTTGSVFQFNPPRKLDPSNRIQREKFNPVPAFTTLPLDLFAPRITGSKDGVFRWEKNVNTTRAGSPKSQSRHQSPIINDNKMRKGSPLQSHMGTPNAQSLSRSDSPAEWADLTLTDITQMSFMVRFGRPLFALRYENGSTDTRGSIVRFGMQKLLNLSIDQVEFGPDNTLKLKEDQAFACLSQRLALQLNIAEYNRASKQIEAHMRLCIKIDHNNLIVKSISGSEPLLAEAAATIMMNEFDWAKQLQTVLAGFSVNAGDRGEVVAMTCALMARDSLIQKNGANKNGIQTGRGGGYRIFSVVDFLDELLCFDGAAPFTHGDKQKKDREEPKSGAAPFTRGDKPKKDREESKSGAAPLVGNAFDSAYMHFNHFVNPLEKSTCNAYYTLSLMVRGAALLCARGMGGVDLVLPFLFGNVLDISAVSAIFVQVKNAIDMTEGKRDEVFRKMEPTIETFFECLKEKPRRPVIRLVLSLGCEHDRLTYSQQTIPVTDSESPNEEDSSEKTKNRTKPTSSRGKPKSTNPTPSKGKPARIETWDFWVQGITSHIKIAEKKSEWEALLYKNPWRDMFTELNGTQEINERKTLFSGGGTHPKFWSWMNLKEWAPSPSGERDG